MARASERFECIRFGSNESELVGRIDFENPPPEHAESRIHLNDNIFIIGPLSARSGAIHTEDGAEIEDSRWGYGHILEWKLPMTSAKIEPGEYCRFRVELANGDGVFDRFPFGEALTLPVLNRKQAASEWTI